MRAPDTVTQVKLRVDGVAKRYGSFTALAETTIEMREGEFLTLLGPSGSGKTTLLMMVAGLTTPDAGDIWIDGHRATHLPPYRRDIGMVFQSYALFPHLTVFENIAFPLRMRRRAEAEIRREVRRVLELVQLPHLAERLPRQLSGGQQQRIALARCIVYQPSIILMDEPLGALDKKLRDQLQLEIKRLHRSLGTTILYVTHDQQETLTMSDRVCLMNHGRVEQVGTPQELYFRPRSLFAADFLGESNILPAHRIGAQNGVMALQVDGIEAPILAPPTDLPGALRIMMRPESLRLAKTADPAWNNAPATLEEVIFTGGVTRYLATLPGGHPMMVTDLTADRAATHAPGDTVILQWRPENTVVLPDIEA